MHHWTDQKIRVHTFYSVLALTIANLMRREAQQPIYTCRYGNSSPTLAGIHKPCCSTPTADQDGPEHNASSPTWTPPSASFTNSSTSTTTLRGP